ncbi:lytic transglycosylase domain-containing protein [Aquabacterium sp. A08]|nr:lytic transglycosylase domain-containing protein [Aquabacterium sp. A08]NIC41444.1 lytic transglycosylase domain-containing protein [Aquabacterium sp. A08]
MAVLTRILLPVAAAFCLPSAGAQTGAERALLDMRQAFQAGNTQRLSALLPQLQGHLLEPQAAYWELRARLQTADPTEIRAFLQRHAGTYHEDRLRNDWLLQLGKARDWTTFAQELPHYRMQDDREVQCYALLAQRERPLASVAAEARSLWLAQRRADDGCATLAGRLLASGDLPAEAAWHRARWALENNQPAVATQAVGLLNPAWVPLVQTVHTDPARYLDEKVTAIRPRTKELVTLALIRLAVRDPEVAATEASRLRWKAQLTDEELGWVWGVIGKRAAQRLSPDAMAHFAQADNRHLNDDLLAWKTRAALRAGQWPQVQAAILAMGAAQREEPVWRYWLARSYAAQGTPEARTQARALYERTAGSAGFYEQLSLEALNRPVVTPPAPAPLTAAEKAAARQHPGLQRALAAIELGLRTEGVREWHYSVALHSPGGMPERELLAAADLACEREVWDRCINTSKRTQGEVDHAQRFPMPFRTAVLQRARDIGLDPAYVYGLIRQESRFITQARSHVGASGLMQVMPATASWTAKRIGLRDFKPEQITERDTNIAIGTAYLKLALDDFEGSMAMAAAAYNAGPGRPRNWRNGPVLEAPVWIENIPFEETRDYVKRVLANTTNYAALISGQPQRLGDRLAPIGPRLATAQAPNNDLP